MDTLFNRFSSVVKQHFRFKTPESCILLILALFINIYGVKIRLFFLQHILNETAY